MKRLAIMVAVVLAVSMAVCTLGLAALSGILNEAQDMVTRISVSMERGDEAAAREGLAVLAEKWDEYAGLMEIICDHEALHSVKERIIQVQICMEYTDMEDFFAALALLGENIDHIWDEEALRLSNLF